MFGHKIIEEYYPGYHDDIKSRFWVPKLMSLFLRSKQRPPPWYLSKKDSPSVMYYYQNGQQWTEHWIYHGQRQRRGGGPSQTIWDKQGNVIREFWFDRDEEHRLDGPSGISYDGNGNILARRWSIKGEQYELRDWLPLSSLTEEEQVIMKLEI